MQSLIVAFLNSHLALLEGVAVGFALSKAPSIVGLGINWLLRIPAVRAYVVAHPEQIKAAVDAIDKEVDSDIDALAQSAAPGPVAHS